MKKTIFTLMIAVLPALPALADGAGSPTTDSDFLPEEINIEIKPGEVKTKNENLAIEAGVRTDSNGETGATVEASAEKEYLLVGSKHRTNSIGMELALGAHGRVDANPDQDGKKDRHVEVSTRGLSLLGIHTQSNEEEPSTTASARKLRAGARYEVDRDADTRHVGAELSGLELSGHTAFRIGEVNIDVCAHTRPLQFLVGQQKIAEHESRTAIRAEIGGCAGVSVGQFRVSNETAYRFTAILEERDDQDGEPIPSNRNHLFSNTVALESRINDRLSLKTSWRFERETTKSTLGEDRQVQRHLVTAGVAF